MESDRVLHHRFTSPYVEIPNAPPVRRGDHIGSRRQKIMLFGESSKKAAGGFRLYFATERSATGPQGHRMSRVSERCRPLGKVSVGVHHAANFRRETYADKNGDRLSEHIGSHRSLLPNPGC
jgi:hypothetical protein